MGNKVIVDTDYILGVSKKISDTSNEMTNSINSLQAICDDLGTNIQDQNMQNFKNNFSSYLTNLRELPAFYNSMAATLNELSREYDSIDNNNAIEIKRSVDSEEGVN